MMKKIQFEKLEMKQEGSWFKRTLASPHFKRTVLLCSVGALIGYALFFFNQGGEGYVLWNDEAMNKVFIGLAFGIFISNSPCSRGRC